LIKCFYRSSISFGFDKKRDAQFFKSGLPMIFYRRFASCQAGSGGEIINRLPQNFYYNTQIEYGKVLNQGKHNSFLSITIAEIPHSTSKVISKTIHQW
jgi:hypothetical protein